METHGCLQSLGHWIVTAYLHVDTSVIELIMALPSEHTNLTYKMPYEVRTGWRNAKGNEKLQKYIDVIPQSLVAGL